jgi:hypothetical protein
MMKKNKMKNIVKITTLAIGITWVQSSYAYWPVMEVPGIVSFQKLNALSGISAAVGLATNSINFSTTQQMHQRDVLQRDTDLRNRGAMGQNDINQFIADSMPTLQQCRELSQSGTKIGAISAAGAVPLTDKNSKLQQQISPAANLGVQLINKQQDGLCSKEEVGAAVTIGGKTVGCTSVGPYPGADIDIYGLEGNINTTEKTNQNDQYANFSMGTKAFQAATDYAHNATLANMPRYMSAAQFKNNMPYFAIYKQFEQRLSAAYEALLDIAKVRRAGNPPPKGSVAATLWNNKANDYKAMFGENQPKDPSLYELLHFNAYENYMGTTALNEKDYMLHLNQQIALSNMLRLLQYKQQENTNILLAQVLTQLTVPLDINKANALYKASTKPN